MAIHAGCLMPDGPVVIDSHVHFWDPAVLRYPWLDDLRRMVEIGEIADLKTVAGLSLITS